MALFTYRAVTERGRKVKGVIDADSLLLAKERLQQQKLLPMQLTAFSERKRELQLNPAARLAFTRELSQLLRAGLPLYESLVTMEEKHRRSSFHALYLEISDSLKAGSSLSAALRRYPKTFDGIYLSMVEAAEQTGTLPQVFAQLALLQTKEQRLKKELFSALAYPLFLGIFCFFLVMALLLFVIPSLQELFEGRRLHPMTEIVLALSQFVRHFGLLVLSVVGAVVLVATLFFRSKQGSVLANRLLFYFPAVHTLLLHAALVRLFRCGSFLLMGGVPLVRSLRLAKGVVKWRAIEKLIERAADKIEEGESLSKEIQGSPFPPMVSRMIAVAEETGRMDEAFQNMADLYEEDLERSLSQITTLLQPALLLLLGLVVGVVLLSILLPLTDVNSFLSM